VLYRSETVQDRTKVIITDNRKLHMRFRLAPISVTLDDLERPKRPARGNKQKFRGPREKIQRR